MQTKLGDGTNERRARRATRVLALLALGLGGTACGGGDAGVGEGTLVLRVSGEGAAKQGYPYMKDNARIEFADQWVVKFTKFLVSFGELQLGVTDGKTALSGGERYVADLKTGDPTVLTLSGLAAGRWDRFGFRVVPPTAASKNLNGVAAADLARMVAGGFNYWIEGTGEKDGETYTFRWGLANPSRYSSCANGFDNTDGFVVKNNGITIGELTTHVDHLFWDTLGREGVSLRFEAIAAAAGADREITFDELAGQRLDDLKDRKGGPLKNERGAPLVYNPGSVPLNAPTLQAFILASGASMGHINGTGLCTVSAL
jgi:hypothetical protein